FSPDGTRVVLSTRRTGDPAAAEGLAIVDVATGRLDPLDWGLPGRQKEPSWQQTVDLSVAAPPTALAPGVGARVPVTVTVTNRGPAPEVDTTLSVTVPAGVRVAGLRPDRGRCGPARPGCDLGLLEPGAVVRIVADLVAVAPGTQRVRWSVAGTMLDQHPADNVADTLVAVRPAAPPPPPPMAGPGLAVAVAPAPAFVGGRVTVTYTARNGGGSTATGLRLDLGLPAGVPVATIPAGCTRTGCALADMPSGGSRVVRVVLAPTAALRADVRGRLETTGSDTNPADNVATAELRVLQPRIVAVPAVGDPGFVTLVRGVDFPTGVAVRLTWSPGITAAAAPTRPGRDGRFTAQLLILAKDQTGPRTITATGAGFSPVTTPFLVVAGTVGPPDLIRRR
ncbi:MAG TPA: hypothetical protein VFX70_13970, partial [Mycobacteriales bacterium]|nr:hypothetical protein [Mycobacteriales bacterium]